MNRLVRPAATTSSQKARRSCCTEAVTFCSTNRVAALPSTRARGTWLTSHSWPPRLCSAGIALGSEGRLPQGCSSCRRQPGSRAASSRGSSWRRSLPRLLSSTASCSASWRWAELRCCPANCWLNSSSRL